MLLSGIGFALRRPRIVVEIWRGSTRLMAHPVEWAEKYKNDTLSRFGRLAMTRASEKRGKEGTLW